MVSKLRRVWDQRLRRRLLSIALPRRLVSWRWVVFFVVFVCRLGAPSFRRAGIHAPGVELRCWPAVSFGSCISSFRNTLLVSMHRYPSRFDAQIPFSFRYTDTPPVPTHRGYAGAMSPFWRCRGRIGRPVSSGLANPALICVSLFHSNSSSLRFTDICLVLVCRRLGGGDSGNHRGNDDVGRPFLSEFSDRRFDSQISPRVDVQAVSPSPASRRATLRFVSRVLCGSRRFATFGWLDTPSSTPSSQSVSIHRAPMRWIRLPRA